MKSLGGLQRVHHVCVKLKHAFQSRSPRTFIQDTVLNRGILNILLKEGFISNILPGDDRGPFVELLSNKKEAADNLLLPHQQQKLEVLKRTRDIIADFHKLAGTDPTKQIPASKLNIQVEPEEGRFSKSAFLKLVKALPPVDAVYIPEPVQSVQDFIHLTLPPQRRLWVDLRYDAQNRPALSDMFLVSKGSRKIFAKPEQMEAVLTGRVYNSWKGSDVGAVTMIRTEQGEILNIKEALKRGVSGEVLCVAK